MSLNKLYGTLVFIQVDKPRACFDKEKGQEFKASIVVDEDTADAWEEAYPKQAAKAIKTSDFEGIYKVPPPEAFAEQRKQFIITLRKNTKLANGQDVPQQYLPKAYHQKGSTLVDITTSILVANGSIGAISVDGYEGKMGPVARLKNILVTDLIEYEPRDSDEDGAEFSEDIGVEKPKGKPQDKPKDNPQEKPTAKKTKAKQEEVGDDSPF